MAKINIANIDDLRVVCVPYERTHDHHTIDQRVAETYTANDYHNKPKTLEEARAKGQTHFNGLSSSFTDIRTYQTPSGIFVAADIMPTRYLIGQAMRDYMKAHPELLTEIIEATSPNMAGVSVIVPTKYKGQYVIIAQVKGKALGSGQIHGAAVAGNVKGKYVLEENRPLIRSLQDECSEELGLNLRFLNSTAFTLWFGEEETGQMNVACVARNVAADTVLETYERSAQNKEYEKREVKGLALIPVENPKSILDSIEVFLPGKEPGWTTEKRELRPYTHALLEYLVEKENQSFLLQKAGF